MTRRNSRLPLALALAVMAAACAQTQSVSDKPALQPIRIDVVATSDLHGWAEPHRATLPDGRALTSGGLSNFAGYLDILRARTPDGVVLVDGGDMFQGTLLSNLFEGRSLIPLLNLLGYDAMALGNHEFDYGPAGPRAAATQPGDDPIGALVAAAGAAKFPFIAHNLYVGDSATRPAGLSPTGYAIVERNGLKIGLLGISTPDTVNVTNPANVATFRFADMVADAQAGVAELRQAGADLVVGVFHEGNSCADLTDPNDLSSCDADRGLIAALQAMPHGLFDAVTGAHTHARIGHFVNGMPVVQSGAQGYAFGLIELSIDPETRRPIPEATRIRSSIPICQQVIQETGDCNAKRFQAGMTIAPATFEGKTIVPNSAIDVLLMPYVQKVGEKQAESLNAQIARPLTRQYRAESLLGNALSEALLQTAGTDFAMLNSGGLRADLKAGPLTYGALYEVLPFDNNVATLTLTGAQIVEMFETLLSSHHGIPQIAGLRLTVEQCSDGAKVVSARDSRGQALDPARLYRMALSDFLAMGGDGLGSFLAKVPDEHKDLGLKSDRNLRDTLAHAIKTSARLPDPGIDGRMTLLPCSDPSRAIPAEDPNRRH